MAEMRDPWQVLGVPSGASLTLIRAQYLRLVRINHPDQFPTGSREKDQHEDAMKDINWAYREILDRAARPGRVPPKSPPRRTPYRARPVDTRDLLCRAHGRFAVIFCTVCATPLCSRCDTSLSGYCSRHRPGGDW